MTKKKKVGRPPKSKKPLPRRWTRRNKSPDMKRRAKYERLNPSQDFQYDYDE